MRLVCHHVPPWPMRAPRVIARCLLPYISIEPVGGQRLGFGFVTFVLLLSQAVVPDDSSEEEESQANATRAEAGSSSGSSPEDDI